MGATEFVSVYTRQVATSLLTSCNNLLQQLDIGMRSHDLRQAYCKLSTDLWQVDCPNLLSTGYRLQSRRQNANWGGGGCLFIYSGSARLTYFEINFISKETSWAEPEYMNIHPPPQLTL